MTGNSLRPAVGNQMTPAGALPPPAAPIRALGPSSAGTPRDGPLEHLATIRGVGLPRHVDSWAWTDAALYDYGAAMSAWWASGRAGAQPQEPGVAGYAHPDFGDTPPGNWVTWTSLDGVGAELVDDHTIGLTASPLAGQPAEAVIYMVDHRSTPRGYDGTWHFCSLEVGYGADAFDGTYGDWWSSPANATNAFPGDVNNTRGYDLGAAYAISGGTFPHYNDFIFPTGQKPMIPVTQPISQIGGVIQAISPGANNQERALIRSPHLTFQAAYSNYRPARTYDPPFPTTDEEWAAYWAGSPYHGSPYWGTTVAHSGLACDVEVNLYRIRGPAYPSSYMDALLAQLAQLASGEDPGPQFIVEFANLGAALGT